MSLNVIKRKTQKVVDDRILCMRCKGRKKMYKVGAGYTNEIMGGKQVDCPMCLGQGKIKPAGEALAELAVQVDTFHKANIAMFEEAVEKTLCLTPFECVKNAESDYTQMASDVEKQKTKSVSKSKGNNHAKKESRNRKA